MGAASGALRQALEPACQFAPHQSFQHGHASLAIVQAIERGIFLPACGQELLTAADRQFLARFQAIGGKAGGVYG